MSDERDDDLAVRHLLALGYVDPDVVARHEETIRRALVASLERALEAYRQGHSAEAVALLERLVAEDPEWIAPRQWLAQMHYWRGRCDLALAQLDWLTWHGVEGPRLSLVAGAIAMARRNLPAALDALEYAWRVEPELPGAATTLASALLRGRQFDRADQLFQAALKLDPDDVRALDGLAKVCLQRGDFDAAVDWALDAVERDMQYWRTHYDLGVALAHMNRPEAALEAFEMCSRLHPSLAAPSRWQARIAAEQLQDTELAEKYQQRGREVIHRRRARLT